MTSNGGHDHGAPADGSVPTRVVVSRRPWAIPAIGLAALAIVLVGLLGQKPVPPVPPQPPATPTPSPAPAGVAWTPIPLDPATFAGALVGLVVGGPQGVLVLGQDRTDRHPISWTSPEGRTWTRHDQPADTFGGGVPDAATAGGPGFIALGYHATADGLRREIWTSPDGATWTRTPSPTGRGFTATTALVGSGGSAVLVADVEGQQRILTSRNGSVWADTPDLDAALGSGPSVFGLTPAAGGYLAVGTTGSDETTIWLSDDGRDWVRVSPPVPSNLESARVFGVYRTHMGFLAVGYLRDPNGAGPAAWTSADGVSWTTSPEDPDLGIGASLQSLYALDGGDVGVTGDGLDGGGVGASLRVTLDLRDWFNVTPPTDGSVDWTRQATVVDGRLLVLGTDARTDAIGAWAGSLTRDDGTAAAPSPTGPTPSSSAGSSPTRTAGAPPPSSGPTVTPPLEWHRLASHEVLEDVAADLHLTGVVRFGSDLIGFGSSGQAGVFWRSTDAVHWRRLPVPATMHGAWIAAVTTFRDRLVAVGLVITAADSLSTPAAWTSTDGVAWTRARGAPDWSAAELTDVVAGPDGLVAVGRRDTEQGQQGAVWTSTDGSAWTPVTSFPGGTSFSTIQAIARGADGFVAVGQAQDDDSLGGGASGAAWTSPDGRTWTAALDETAYRSSVGGLRGPDPELTDVVAGGPGFVAVGSLADANGIFGAIFTSPDGRSWTRVAGDSLLASSSLVTATTWAGGLAVGGNAGGRGPSHPVVWTSPDGRDWVAADDADFRARGVTPNESLSALVGEGPGLVAVGTGSVFSGPSEASVWVGVPPGRTVADHVCPARIDSLARLASMTAADRAACIGDQPVTIQALARSTINDCGSVDVPDLSGCGPTMELAALDGGYAQLTVPIDLPLSGTLGNEAFTPWAITMRTGVQGPTCQPAPLPNGVLYEPAASIELQCKAVLRVVSEKRIVP